MKHIIGSKDVFAIECEFTDKSEFHNAKTRIWCGNVFFGNYEDSSPIYGIYHFFNFISDNPQKFKTDEFKGKAKEEIYQIMIPYETDEEFYELPDSKIEELIKYDRNIGSFNEAYDEFVTRIYVEDENIHFIWKLITDDERQQSLYKGYPLGIVHKSVPLKVFKKVINEFRNTLTKEGVLKG